VRGLADNLVPAPEPPPGPNLGRLRSTVEEFFRRDAIVPVMLSQRRDYLAAGRLCGCLLREGQHLLPQRIDASGTQRVLQAQDQR
jgi:hypothetical protein